MLAYSTDLQHFQAQHIMTSINIQDHASISLSVLICPYKILYFTSTHLTEYQLNCFITQCLLARLYTVSLYTIPATALLQHFRQFSAFPRTNARHTSLVFVPAINAVRVRMTPWNTVVYWTLVLLYKFNLFSLLYYYYTNVCLNCMESCRFSFKPVLAFARTKLEIYSHKFIRKFEELHIHKWYAPPSS